MTVARATCSQVAHADPPEIAAANPIHDEKATGYGYAGAIVAGISTYGWMVPAILDAVGEGWLAHGWAEVRFPRPVFTGDELITEITPSPEDARIGTVTQRVASDGRVTIEGRVGLGDGPWRHEFDLPTRRDPVPPNPSPRYTPPESIPTFEDYPPMSMPMGPDDARAWARSRIHTDDARWHDDPDRGGPVVHPSWAPGQMTPLIRHSYKFPAGVHAAGRIQHLALHRANGPVTVAGRWGGVEVRKGKHWSTTDAVFLGPDGTELSLVRQVAVILPPPPR